MTDGLKEAYKDAQKYAQDKIMITCPKCHGKGEYEVAHYEDDELLDCVEIWESRHCELCYGTGKVTLEFYESIQKRCRR